MTSAPKSPRIWPQKGPARTREASRTRTPVNGACGSVIITAVSNLTLALSAGHGYCKGCRDPCCEREQFTQTASKLSPLAVREQKRIESHMAVSTQTVTLYRELADLHEQQGQPQLRDRFLVLAADAALATGKSDDAERIRAVLSQLNPHHLLQPFPTFAEAAKTA